MKKIFGTDGVRGKANVYPMTADVAVNIGKAIALLFKRKNHRSKIIIGKDTRISGYVIEYAISAGICSMGCDVILTGPIPTAGIAYLTYSLRADAGIVISASHNPFEDNGIKIFASDGFKLSDEKEKQIEELALNPKKMEGMYPAPHELGKAQKLNDARSMYNAFLKNTFPKKYDLEGMKIALDCANGATYQVAPQLLSELNAEVRSIGITPDGTNINKECGSQHTEKLVGEVRENKMDVGFAFDGDGDRLIAVDETGAILTGDQIIAICAKYLKKTNTLTNNLVVTTVMSNIGFDIAMKELGITHIVTCVGDRYVLEEMQKCNAILGGEDSGHIIFLDKHTTGDGILSALEVLTIMKEEKKPLSELKNVMKVFPQKLVNIDVKEKKDLEKIPQIHDVIKDTEKRLKDRGRVLVRYSGTQSMCRVMIEAPTTKETEEYCSKIADVIQKILGV